MKITYKKMINKGIREKMSYFFKSNLSIQNVHTNKNFIPLFFKYIQFHYIIYFLFFSLALVGCKSSEPKFPEQPPTITVSGQNPLKTGIYMLFVDDSIKVNDRYYGIDSIWTKEEPKIDTSLLGYYKIHYYVRSLSGMMAEAERKVWVVVKPESMKGEWNVDLKILPSNDSLSFTDLLSVENKKLFINNLNNIPKLKVELSLATDLQDSIYIFEKNISDSLYYIIGSGIIDECAQQMKLNYFINGEDVMMKCEATYSRKDTTLTK